MKNKKLFAILTLVCFMFTLMPVAAFAANNAVLANGDDKATVEVGDVVTLAVDPAGDYLFFAVDEAGDLDQVTTNSVIAFDEVGTYKVYAADSTSVNDINAELISKAAKLELLMELDSLVDDYANVKVKAGDVDYRIVLDATPVDTNKYEIYVAANEGWYDGQGDVVATLEKSSNGGAWEAVKGADLTFTTAGYVDVITEDGKTTDRGGDVEFEVVSDRAGEYKVIVKYGTKAKAELAVNVYAEEVANVELAAGVNAPVDVDSDVVGADIEFKFTDASGRAYNYVDVDDENEVKITVTKKPADSTADEDTFSLAKDSDDTTGVWTLNGEFDEEGEYTIKVTLRNGKSASVTVKAAEMGEVVGIKYDVMNTPRTVAYGAGANVDAVLAYDANGVTKKVSDETVFSANGVAVADLVTRNLPNGTTQYAYVTVENDDDFIGKTITIFAEYEDFVTSQTLTVVDKAEGISFPAANAEVGVNTEITGAVVDAQGNRSSIASDIVGRGLTGNGLVLEKPENAVAIATWSVDGKGNIVLDFLGSEEGEYKVQVAVSYNDSVTGTKRFIAGTAEITVGAGAGTFEDVVVMSIGANNIVVNSEVKAIPAAPMIKDARTFVPFRALAEAFGANVEWVEATQSVIAELNGVKVVMTIGANEYTVNGVAKTADVAPFINGASTMVPVRFVAEAFGITVTPIADETGAVVDVLFAK